MLKDELSRLRPKPSGVGECGHAAPGGAYCGNACAPDGACESGSTPEPERELSGDGETSPSVASSTDATVKASPRHSQVRVTTGSQIYLVKADCVVTVVGMDVIGQRYLLRNEDTRYEWYETLTGSGRVTWNTVASKPTPLPLQGESSCSACEEPPPPKEAPAPRMTRKGQRKAVRAAELAAEEFQCPICCYDLDDTSAPHRGEWGAHMLPPQRCSPPRPPPLCC